MRDPALNFSYNKNDLRFFELSQQHRVKEPDKFALYQIEPNIGTERGSNSKLLKDTRLA